MYCRCRNISDRVWHIESIHQRPPHLSDQISDALRFYFCKLSLSRETTLLIRTLSLQKGWPYKGTSVPILITKPILDLVFHRDLNALIATLSKTIETYIHVDILIYRYARYFLFNYCMLSLQPLTHKLECHMVQLT
jgi:hypothetical protein